MVKPAGRGCFDRGDLKEAGGGAGRAMEPLVCFLELETGRADKLTRSEIEEAALEAPKAAGSRLKRHSGLNASEEEANRTSSGDTSAPASKGT